MGVGLLCLAHGGGFCPSGTYSAGFVCEPCPMGKYKPRRSKLPCSPCPSASHTARAGSPWCLSPDGTPEKSTVHTRAPTPRPPPPPRPALTRAGGGGGRAAQQQRHAAAGRFWQHSSGGGATAAPAAKQQRRWHTARCPAGKYSAVVGAGSPDTCEPCPPGK